MLTPLLSPRPKLEVAATSARLGSVGSTPSCSERDGGSTPNSVRNALYAAQQCFDDSRCAQSAHLLQTVQYQPTFAAEHADVRAVASIALPALRVRKRHESKDEQALLASSQRHPSVAPPHLVHPLFDGQHREPSRPQGRQAARGLIARMHIEVVGSSMEATHNINAQCAMYTRSDTCTMRNVHT